MTTNFENHNAPICELNDGELDCVSGGTSGLMHAVAAAAYKALNDEYKIRWSDVVRGTPNC